MSTSPFSAVRIKILIAEDSPIQALQLKRILEAKNCEVQVARNGQEALDYLQEIATDRQVWLNHRPAMLISDIVMPQMDGCQLCFHIKNDEKLREIPVILLTSLSDSRDALRGLYSGADNLISKPYKSEFLLARVDEIVENQAAPEGATPESKALPITMDGQKYFVTIERLRVINLILTTYETAVQKNLQLEEAQRTIAEQENLLQAALATIEKQEAELSRLRDA